MGATLRRLPAVLGAALLFVALFVVRREFHDLRLDTVGRALHAIPGGALVLAFLFTILSYAGLTLYDWLGTIYAGRKVRYGRVAFASFCAYALSHSLGFAAVSGAAVRYRLYAQWGLTPGQIARVVAFCSLSFGLGGMVLGGTILLLEPESVVFLGDRMPLALLYGCGVLLWAIVAGYVGLARRVGTVRLFGQAITLPGFRMALVQVALATADVALTATIFWVLLPTVPRLSWLVFLGIYVAGYTAGLAANVPGGIGVFDSAVLFGLAPFLPAPRVAAAIVVYRLYYYVIPLFLAGSLFAANEALLRGAGLLSPRLTMRRLHGVPAPPFALAAATGAVGLSGLLLLGLGVLAPHTGHGPGDLAVLAGQFEPSLVGAGLVMLGAALSQRVTLVWWLTLLLLALGSVLVSVRHDPSWIAGVLALSALMLVPFRTRFYRPARLFGGELDRSTAAALLALVVGVLGLVGFRGTPGLSAAAWWQIVMTPGATPGLRISVALTVLPGLLALWFLLRPGRVAWSAWDTAAEARVAPSPGTGLPDGVVWGEAGRAGIPFCRLGRILLGLGDPTGPEGDRISAIWRLRDLAAQEGRDPAVWHVGPELLKVYGDLGLVALPLGPDGLPAEGPSPAARFLVCAAERDLAFLLPRLKELAGAS